MFPTSRLAGSLGLQLANSVADYKLSNGISKSLIHCFANIRPCASASSGVSNTRSWTAAGANALLWHTLNRGSLITNDANDGVTIAEVIEPENEFEALAAQTFREVAKKTNERAGDGTTSTVVIVGKLIKDVFA